MKTHISFLLLMCCIIHSAQCDVTISSTRSFSLAGTVFPDDLKNIAERAYRASLAGDTRQLLEKTSKAEREISNAKLLEFGRSLVSPDFCALLSGFEGQIPIGDKPDAYMIILNVIGGIPNKSFSLSSVVHVWYKTSDGWGLSVIGDKSTR